MTKARLTMLLLITLAVAACNTLVGCDAASGRRASEANTIPAPPDVAAPPGDAIRNPSGLASKVLTPGTGTRHPRPNSRVRVHYTGWKTNGEMFDSSVTRGEPISFGLDNVIPGWTEGLQMMVEGEKRRFWIPAKLAYEGTPDRPQGMLVFDVELIRIES
jgi:peptidylprolyl isomerase